MGGVPALFPPCFICTPPKTGDGWKGWAEKGPFDAIHVGAAASSVPEDLVAQLKVGGRMVVPVGPQSASQVLMQVSGHRTPFGADFPRRS